MQKYEIIALSLQHTAQRSYLKASSEKRVDTQLLNVTSTFKDIHALSTSLSTVLYQGIEYVIL